jgi:hypothetical protein
MLQGTSGEQWQEGWRRGLVVELHKDDNKQPLKPPVGDKNETL